MRYLTTVAVGVVTASALLITGTSPARAFGDNTPTFFPSGTDIQHHNLLAHMFNGIKLTELQHQQMRDLIQQTDPVVSINDMKTLHQLIIADQFNEVAVRNLMEQIGKRQTDRQVEMMKVRNQMYHLLTKEQQTQLEQNYQQRMQRLQESAWMQ